MAKQDSLLISGKSKKGSLKIKAKEEMRREDLRRRPAIEAKIKRTIKALADMGLERGKDYEIDLDTGKVTALSEKAFEMLHPNQSPGELKAERERLARGGRRA